MDLLFTAFAVISWTYRIIAVEDASEIELVRASGFDERQQRADALVAILHDTSKEIFTQALQWNFQGCNRLEILHAFCDAAVSNGLPAGAQFQSDNLSRLIAWLRSVNMPESVIIRILYKDWLLRDRETTRALLRFFPPMSAASILLREFRLPFDIHIKLKPILQRHERSKSLESRISSDPISLLEESLARRAIKPKRAAKKPKSVNIRDDRQTKRLTGDLEWISTESVPFLHI